jgi:hypothetical protein
MISSNGVRYIEFRLGHVSGAGYALEARSIVQSQRPISGSHCTDERKIRFSKIEIAFLQPFLILATNFLILAVRFIGP